MKRKSIVLLILSAVLTFSLFGCAPTDESGGGGTAGGKEINLLDYFEDEVYNASPTNTVANRQVVTTLTKLTDKESFNAGNTPYLFISPKRDVKIKKISYDIKYSGKLNFSLNIYNEDNNCWVKLLDESNVIFNENEIKTFTIDKPITFIQLSISKGQALIFGSRAVNEENFNMQIDNLKIELELDK